MLKLNPHDTWIYYQMIVSIATVVIAISNVLFAFSAYKFFKKTKSIVMNIERNTRVLKTYVLLKRAHSIRSKAAGNVIRESIKDEERFRDDYTHQP